MFCANLGEIELDYKKLDDFINNKISSGMNVNEEVVADFNLEELYCYDKLKEYTWIRKSVGLLGGGNHFIEIDKKYNTVDI